MNYKYLLGMPFWNLTYERIDGLKKNMTEKQKEIELIQKATAEELWLRDLDEFEEIYRA